MSTSTPGDPLVDGTGRASVAEAISWVADDHPLTHHADRQAMLRELVGCGGDGEHRQQALRRLAREVARSELDSAAVLFEYATIAPAERFRVALDQLATKCPDKTLTTINPSAVIAAQRDNSFTIETLCAAAGVSYSELVARLDDIPSKATARWAPTQVRRAFKLFDQLVRGELETDLPGSVPARALELMPGIGVTEGGWQSIEEMRTGGVPYEALLAQRAAGGSWLAHRNRTSSKLTPILADRLCKELDERGVSYRRSTELNGDTPPGQMTTLSGCDKQIGIVVFDADDSASFGVIFSVARDSGTASKSASRLRAMKRRAGLPVAVVVAGPGWAARNETADLAVEFDGRIYSERAIDKLAVDIAEASTT